MLKLNFRSLFLMLGVIILLIVSVGCGHVDDKTLNNKEDIQSNEEQQMPDIEVSELCERLSTNMTTENDKIVSFRAEPYINPGISWEYSLDIKIEDGKIYINDTLYEESSSAPPAVLYNDGFLVHADYIDEVNHNQEIANTLTKIKNSDSCYILETNQVCKTGQKISVYEIDGAYYFVRFYDNGEVMRIHYAAIE